MMYSEDHAKAVQEWLNQNVEVYETPHAVEISCFEVEHDRFSGSFQISLDGTNISKRFRFGLGSNGKPELFFPMYHSPMGAPASYGAVDLTGETTSAIKHLLMSVLPEMKALGYNRRTGETIFLTTHSESDRIVNASAYSEAIKRLAAPGFTVRCAVNGTQPTVQPDGPAFGGSAG